MTIHLKSRLATATSGVKVPATTPPSWPKDLTCKMVRGWWSNFRHLQPGLEAVNPDLPALSNTDKWQSGMEQSKWDWALKAFPHLQIATMPMSFKVSSVYHLFCGNIKGSKKRVNSCERWCCWGGSVRKAEKKATFGPEKLSLKAKHEF